MKYNLKESKYFFTFLSSIVALTVLILVFYSVYIYLEIKSSETKISQEYLSNFTSRTNSLISSFDNISTQIAMLPSVNALLYETEARDLSGFSRLNKDLGIFSNYTIYNSIYVYFRASDLIFSTNGGLDKLEEFQEKDFLKALSTGDSGYKIYPSRNVRRIFQIPETVKIFTFVRQIPLFNSCNGYVLININYDSLASIIDGILPQQLKDVCIVKDDTMICSTNKGLEDYLAGSGYNPGGGTIDIGGKKYILLHNKLYPYDFDIYSLIPLSSINNGFLSKMKGTIKPLALILIVELFISWFLSLLMTKPLNRLIKKIQAHSPKLSSHPEELSGIDGLDQALEGLFKYENDILSAVEANMPVLRESILLGMIWGNDNSLSSSSEEKFSQYGIEFNKKYYYAIISSIDEIDRIADRQIKDQIKLYIKENVTHFFTSFGNTYGVLLENNRLAFILNTDFDIYRKADEYQKVFNTTLQIHEHILSELSVNVVFSFGPLETSPGNIHKSYMYAANNLMYSSIYNDEYIVFCSQGDAVPFLDRLPYAELVTFIINKDEEAILAYINSFAEKCIVEKLCDAQVKRLLITLISSIYSALWEKGINISTNNLTLSISKITGIGDFTKLHLHIADIIKNITSQIGLGFDEQQNKKICAAIDFMEENYHRDLSINEIAEHVGLNHIYLNRIFKLSTGKTLSEYLNIFRIEKSKEFLNNTCHSINDISKMVGYNDVRSYIRFFKKFFGVTPKDFRTHIQ